MTLKEFAEKLDGTEYNGYPIFSKEDIEIAKENGFVIVTGLPMTLWNLRALLKTKPDALMADEYIFQEIE